jgi:hypothetical protein
MRNKPSQEKKMSPPVFQQTVGKPRDGDKQNAVPYHARKKIRKQNRPPNRSRMQVRAVFSLSAIPEW